ncbi:hypothetical protein [Pontiella sp.]|uniref:hypothetical protein n=1 Tax=Pontiella sp. TaxID=2837462 RepID=UPI003562D175
MIDEEAMKKPDFNWEEYGRTNNISAAILANIKARVAITEVDQIVEHDQSLIAVAESVLMQYIKENPADISAGVGRVEIAEVREEYMGAQPAITNSALASMVNSRVQTSRDNNRDFFVRFEIADDSRVKSISIGVWNGFEGTGYGRYYGLRLVNGAYEHDGSDGCFLLD